MIRRGRGVVNLTIHAGSNYMGSTEGAADNMMKGAKSGEDLLEGSDGQGTYERLGND